MQKYQINGKSLYRYLLDQGFSESYYKKISWRINHKMMTPEEALKFEPVKAREDQHARRLECGRRFRGYSEDELHITTEQAKERGRMKRVQTLYHGKPLSDWCKEYNHTYGCINWRLKHGWDLMTALQTPARGKAPTYKGVSIYELFGKGHRSLVWWRLQNGWGFEAACTCPVQDKHRPRSEKEKPFWWQKNIKKHID